MRGEGESRENYWTMYGGGHELSKLTHYSDHGSPVRQQDFSGSFHFSHIQVSGSCTVGTGIRGTAPKDDDDERSSLSNNK